jgi:hypothetical protein
MSRSEVFTKMSETLSMGISLTGKDCQALAVKLKEMGGR